LAIEQIGFEFTFTPKHDTRLMSADELQIAVDIDEKHNIEGKSARYGAKELGDCFLCGLIFPSGGVIVVGVENDGQLAGCNAISADRLNEFQRAGDVCRLET
jgi:hypothetical protein